ncbi:MAG: BLUF domain-containing protein [Beijerinckiaceae bacterium]|nr:BLUF domain-containing protein [Beijerinckiaceae bacterium]
MSEPLIFQLAYASALSASKIDDPMQTLREILDASRRNNARSGITGYLIFDGAAFVQILEGDQLAVLATYVRIERDPRHRDVRIIGSQRVAKRRFGSWWMDGYLRSPRQDHIFRDHGFVGQMDWTRLSISAAIELAGALQGVDNISRPS